MTINNQHESTPAYPGMGSAKTIEYSIFDLFELLQSKWKVIALITFISFLGSIIVALVLPVKFEAQALLAPSSKDSQGSNRAASIARELTTLGAIAGLNLPSSTTTTETAIAVLKSRKFLVEFIDKHQISFSLFEDQWDPETEQWFEPEPSTIKVFLSKFKSAFLDPGSQSEKSPFPTNWDKYRAFSEILSVENNTETGLITLSIRWKDPAEAAIWANQIVKEINNYFRFKSIEESKNSIKYLNSQLEIVVNNDISLVIYQLIEEHTKTIALASVKQDFVFEVLDPAITPDEKTSPKRKLIVAIGLFFGFAAGCFMVLLLAFFISAKEYSNTQS